jgi:hypothetical protein
MYKERNPKSTMSLGDRVRYGHLEALAELQFLIDWIMDLDVRISEKYDLPTQPRIPRPKIADLT